MTDKDTATPTDDEALTALKASDPAAFDLDSESEPAIDAKAEEDQAAKDAADKVEAEKAEADKADTAKNDAVDRKKFDGVLGDLRDTRVTLAQERERAESLAAELAALKAGPAIDYDTEIKALDEKWNGDDDFDGSHADYLAQRDALLVGKAKADARAEFQQEQRQAAEEVAQRTWAESANAFVAAHPEYKDDEVKADLEAALHGVFAKFPNDSDADKLERAHKIVQAMNGKVAPANPADPNAARNAADAQASAKASSAPPVVSGGVSSGGGPAGSIDMANLKPGQFSKLTKEQQAAMLGSADAL